MFRFLHTHAYTHVCLMPLYYFMQTHKDGFLDGRKEVVCGVGAVGKEKIQLKIISTLA